MERRCTHTFFLYLFTITLIIICSGTQRSTAITAMPMQDAAIQSSISQSAALPDGDVSTDSVPASEIIRPDSQTLANPFWPQVEELLNSYVSEDFDAYVSVTVWDHWNDIDREQEYPTKYIFPASLWENDKEYLDFYVWVEEIDGTDILKTNFPQQLFAQVLAECTYSAEEQDSSAYLIGNLPSFSQYAIPYYELLEEPLVLQASADDSEVTTIFENAYNKMYDWQSHITGDLSQNIRFCDAFSPADEEVYLTPEKPEAEMNSMEFTNWVDTMSIQGYHNWVEKNDLSFPEHLISFDEDYDTAQEELFAALLEEREAYHAASETNMETVADTIADTVSDMKAEATSDTTTDTEIETVSDTETDAVSDTIAESGSSTTYVVCRGDSLWEIAKRYYGDGQYVYKIWEDNREIIGDNMNFILPGMQLEITELSIS